MDDKYIVTEYENGKSLPELAEEFNTYPNKIRRRLLKLGVKMRDKSESQKIALSSGRTEHPTKGKARSEDTKLKLSNAAANTWANYTPSELKSIKQKLTDAWGKKSKEDLLDMQKKAATAISKAGREGSKMEKFLLEKLPERGYNILAHKKGLIPNTNLEPDFVLPDIKVIIEIDGPTHFFPIFGQETLDKTIASDAEKNGLFLQHGYCVLRIRHICKTLTEFKKRAALEEIVSQLEYIKKHHVSSIIEIEI